MKFNFNSYLSKNKEIIILVFLAIVFFVIYSWFPLASHKNLSVGPVFNSPDETANYFWTSRVAHGMPLYFWESDNEIGNGLLHPRSMNGFQGKIVPGSFLGMVLVYGALAKIIGLQVIPFLTPFFASLAVLFFYLLLKLFFDKKIAFISSVLLLFFPGWWYYAARGMYHNIFFVSTAIVGLYFLCSALEKKNFGQRKIFQYFHYIFAGLFLGLAVLIRTSEVVWLTIVVLLILFFNFKKINWVPFIFFVIVGATTFLIPLFYHNLVLYNSFFSFSYRLPFDNTGWQGIFQGIASHALFQILVTPFGFNPRSIILNGYNYLVKFLWFWSVPTLFGLIIFLLSGRYFKAENRKKNFAYLIVLVFVSIYLLVFYGSWQISDRIDQASVSIGTSYLRYWLPIYLLALPLLAIFIYEIIRLFKYFFFKASLFSVLMIILFLSSLNLVIFETDESLSVVKNNVLSYQQKSLILKQLLRPDSIVVTYPQADKFIFPVTSRLITALVVPYDYFSLARLVAKNNNVFYYTFLSPAAVEYTSQNVFLPYNLAIRNGRKIFQNDWLYQIELIKGNSEEKINEEH